MTCYFLIFFFNFSPCLKVSLSKNNTYCQQNKYIFLIYFIFYKMDSDSEYSAQPNTIFIDLHVFKI